MTGTLTDRRVPGAHDKLLEPGNVEGLAAAIREGLERAAR